jgi:hypothetical protein
MEWTPHFGRSSRVCLRENMNHGSRRVFFYKAEILWHVEKYLLLWRQVELTHNELGMSIITDKHSRVVGEDHQNTRARE